MARYQLRVHSQDGTIDYAVPIHEKTEKIDVNYTKKNELFTIDRYIFASFKRKEELLEHLKQYNFNVTEDMTPYISYQHGKKKQVLQVFYQSDMELLNFSELFTQLSKFKLSQQEKRKILYHDEIWKNFISELLYMIFDDSFYDFLKDNLHYVNPYIYDCIEAIRDNAKWERSDENEAYHTAINMLMEIYTSYKQIRGMKLAIQSYENLLLKEQGTKVNTSTNSSFISKPYCIGDEDIDSYIKESDESYYIEELLKLYSLDELSNLPDEVKEQIRIDGMSR